MKKLFSVLLVVFLLVGCIPTPEPIPEKFEDISVALQRMIPKTATNVYVVDSQWCYFDLDGSTYLLGVRWFGDNGYSAITKVK